LLCYYDDDDGEEQREEWILGGEGGADSALEERARARYVQGCDGTRGLDGGPGGDDGEEPREGRECILGADNVLGFGADSVLEERARVVGRDAGGDVRPDRVVEG
jgi:hypothetical protein